MNFLLGLLIGICVGFGVSLLMMSTGTLSKEKESYRKGYNDGVNSVKKETE